MIILVEETITENIGNICCNDVGSVNLLNAIQEKFM